MDEVFFDMMEFLKRPSITETLVDVLLCSVPIWLAVMIGLVIGWSWRPRWTGLVFLGLRSKFRFIWTAPLGFCARRLWLAFTALSAFSACRALWNNFKGKGRKPYSPTVQVAASISGEGGAGDSSPSAGNAEREQDVVTENDLECLLHLLEKKDGETDWQSLMERSTPNMRYQAWRHEPQTGSAVYRNRTVFEGVSPELVRDFFWDNEFRCKWDPMLSYVKIWQECPHTRTMIVHWIKSSLFSAVIENISLVEEYGRRERAIIV